MSTLAPLAHECHCVISVTVADANNAKTVYNEIDAANTTDATDITGTADVTDIDDAVDIAGATEASNLYFNYLVFVASATDISASAC